MTKTARIILALAAVAGLARAETTVDPAALKNWQDMRFGMFIHWGPVSLTGHEIGWSRGSQTPIEKYDSLYKEFNPTNYNADEWVAVAKAAGMKYVVLTTKHHDGFCLWDTKQMDYNIMKSPFARDVVKELSAACKKQGLRFGTYYSTTDWWHPDHPNGSPGGKTKKPDANLDRYTDYLKAQVKELIENYGPLSTLWFDVPQAFDKTRGQGVVDFVRGLQPDIVINNRTGAPGDYDTPEQKIGGFKMDRPWETCMTICRQWAWKPNDNMKSLKECVQTLVRTVGGDGNLLFNVGPMPDGRIEDRQIERLKEMGAWVTKHGVAIYGTRGGPYKPAGDIACTRKGSTIYVHVLNGKATMELPALPAKIVKTSVVGGGEAKTEQTAETLKITITAGLDEIDTVVALEIEGDAMKIEPIAVAAAGNTAKANAVFSSQYEAGMAVDGDEHTRWATPGGMTSAWIEISLPKVASIGSATILQEEDYAARIQSYEFQAEVDGAWKTLASGDKIAAKGRILFEPVTAKKFRLNITKASDGPTINEIVLK